MPVYGDVGARKEGIEHSLSAVLGIGSQVVVHALAF